MEIVRKVNQKNRRHLFIADQTGKMVDSFKYNNYVVLHEVHGEIKRVIISKKQTKEEATQNIREKILNDMRIGRQSVLNIETMVAMWKDYGLKPFFDFDSC
jgi:capsule polysaccharide modification protein KpsS